MPKKMLLAIFFFCAATLTGHAAVCATVNVSVAQPYGEKIPLAAAVSAARTEALLKAHFAALRQLAHEPVMQHIGIVTETYSPPDINGLVYYLHTFSLSHSVDPGTKTVTATAIAKPEYTDLRTAVLNTLPRTALLKRYGAVLAQQQKELERLKQLTQPAASPLPEQPEKTGQNIAWAGNSLDALERYRALLARYADGWDLRENIQNDLEELLLAAPDNPLIHGALAEVLYQREKPQQAQQHIDAALANAPLYSYLHDTRGLILLQLKLPALATQSFAEAIAQDSHNPSYYQHRGTSLLVQNKLVQMCQDFSKACVLGDCTGYQWAHEQGLCHEEGNSPAAP